MANTIKDSTGIQQSHSVSRVSSKGVSVNQSTSTKAADGLQISKTLASIRTLSASLAKGEVIDHARVDKIRSAINSGEYTIDTDRIAKKFLELEKILNT